MLSSFKSKAAEQDKQRQRDNRLGELSIELFIPGMDRMAD
jgi:hypothetical protein